MSECILHCSEIAVRRKTALFENLFMNKFCLGAIENRKSPSDKSCKFLQVNTVRCQHLHLQNGTCSVFGSYNPWPFFVCIQLDVDLLNAMTVSEATVKSVLSGNLNMDNKGNNGKC